MRVRYVHQGYFPARAGAELMARSLAVAMRRRGLDVGLYGSEGDPEDARLMKAEGIGVDPLPVRDGEERAADLVHAVDAFQPENIRAGLRLARSWGVPFAVTTASAPEVWPDRAAVVEGCRRADAVFVLTDAEREMLLAEGVADSVLHRIGQGAHLPGTADPEGFRAAHGITGPVVLFLGRKMRSKGYRVLLDATRHVWARHPEAHFVFLGPRWDADCAERFAAHADPRITELDRVDEDTKHSALAACDLLCLPSTADVFPLVFVEAWMCGKPVIGSAFMGSAEVIADGRDGLIVAPAARPVADAVSRLLADPAERARMGREGRQRARRELTWDAVAAQVHRVYTELVPARS
ncbi:glycosyltransferase family 4 protein [Streptomyces crystallinus]